MKTLFKNNFMKLSLVLCSTGSVYCSFYSKMASKLAAAKSVVKVNAAKVISKVPKRKLVTTLALTGGTYLGIKAKVAHDEHMLNTLRSLKRKNNKLLYCENVLYPSVPVNNALAQRKKLDLSRTQSFNYAVLSAHKKLDEEQESKFRLAVSQALDADHRLGSSCDLGLLSKFVTYLTVDKNDDVDPYLDRKMVTDGILLFANNEAKYADTHVAFYHGTSDFKGVLDRTLLFAKSSHKPVNNFLLLRDLGCTNKLRSVENTRAYMMDQKPDALFEFRGNLSRPGSDYPYDNYEPYRTLYLSVCMAATSDALFSAKKSLDFLYKQKVNGVGGAVIQILVPKQMLHLDRIYEAGSAGVPLSWPKKEQVSLLEKLNLLQAGKMPHSTFQVRIPLDPDVFEVPGKVIFSVVYWSAEDETRNTV